MTNPEDKKFNITIYTNKGNVTFRNLTDIETDDVVAEIDAAMSFNRSTKHFDFDGKTHVFNGPNIVRYEVAPDDPTN